MGTVQLPNGFQAWFGIQLVPGAVPKDTLPAASLPDSTGRFAGVNVRNSVLLA